MTKPSLLPIFLLTAFLAFCQSQKQEGKKVFDDENYDRYKIISYNHRDSIDIKEEVKQMNSNETASLEKPRLFLYYDKDDNIRIAVQHNIKWITWQILNYSDQRFYASLDQVNFDEQQEDELLIQGYYQTVPQSTFGSSYSGIFQLWNINVPHLYFEIENYSYEDDFGRNGDQSFSSECSLQVEVLNKQIKVHPPSYKFVMLSSERDTLSSGHEQHERYDKNACISYFLDMVGKYELINGELKKFY